MWKVIKLRDEIICLPDEDQGQLQSKWACIEQFTKLILWKFIKLCNEIICSPALVSKTSATLVHMSVHLVNNLQLVYLLWKVFKLRDEIIYSLAIVFKRSATSVHTSMYWMHVHLVNNRLISVIGIVWLIIK